MTTPDPKKLVYAAEALERAAGSMFRPRPNPYAWSPGEAHDNNRLGEACRDVAAWLRELVREQGEQPVFDGAGLAALREGARLAGVELEHQGEDDDDGKPPQ
jgi:hypothetical protein